MDNRNENDSGTGNRLTFFLLLFVFCIPVLGAWWLLNFSDVVEEGNKSNHGDLIMPPRPLPDLVLNDPLTEAREGKLYGKWSLFYITKDGCDAPCLENLYRMRQVRLATGKHDHRVQRVLMVLTGNDKGLKEQFKEYAGQWVVDVEGLDVKRLLENFRFLENEQPAEKNRLYIVDPLGNLMMRYSPDADPIGIIEDLKHLLNASLIG